MQPSILSGAAFFAAQSKDAVLARTAPFDCAKKLRSGRINPIILSRQSDL
jgi:hypothetical protein